MVFLDEISPDEARVERAKFEDFYFSDIDEQAYSALTITKNGRYRTSLNNCTCPDYQKRKKPCKHIYRLSALFNKYSLYKNSQQEEIRDKINQISDLITAEKMKDIFYRCRDNKYYSTEKDIQTDFLERIGLISFQKIPMEYIVNKLYDKNDLVNFLSSKIETKGLLKKDLVNLFLSYDDLINKIPEAEKEYVKILIDDENLDFLIDAINFRIYYQLKNSFGSPVKQKNTVITLILCLFFGMFGTHQFYLGNRNKAVKMLLLGLISGFAISLIWSYIDLFFIVKKMFNNNK